MLNAALAQFEFRSAAPARAGAALKFDVSTGIRVAQVPKRISGALDPANALGLIDYGICPIRTFRARAIDAKHRPFAASLGQGPSRRFERVAVVCHDDGSYPFDPVDDVEGHRLSPAAHGRASHAQPGGWRQV